MKQGNIQQKILLLKVQNLDEKAFSAIYDLYVNKIYRYIYFKVPNELDVEDLTSNVFLKMWNYVNSDNTAKINNLNAFLYKIARNLVIDYYRARNENVLNIDTEILAQIKDETNDITKKVAVNSELEQILKVLPRLKKEYREVIILKYLEELNISEIAEILHKNRGAVRIMLHRALNMLRKILIDRNNSDS